ncbi:MULTISPECIES: hypothetical protein [Bacillus]|uniref:Uncharacterized protein n=4 Tax=Bacillus cereus group TaxID=86661 RepID=A0A9W5KQY5_BACCE|nr:MULTISPECIES: hypothetical protein [Bacillus cereus group]EKS8366072.1 hypothetical protein [Bacillus cereus]AHA75451.1 hypothetical protein YBT1518_33821 [Bacillus thuringiensis YBT-1518]EEM44419.1 hypothetical protein bthur0005_58290 [Bacillus thuringiensis serovar pakistani str. T13001]EJR61685.1 hypothetical protein IK5_06028 [Bacillus cereus VD154]EKS8373235.1 hypothetical protein [Bacillus cereus]
MKSIYRSKRYTFSISHTKKLNKYLCDKNKTNIGKRIYTLAKEGYECIYPVRKVIITEQFYKLGDIHQLDYFYETEMEKI